MIRHYFTKQFLGFVTVGGLAALLHWISRIILSNWFSFSTAVIIAYGVGMCVAFTLSSFFVFPASKKSKYSQIRGFFFVNLALMPLVWIATMTFEHAFRTIGLITHAQAIAHGIAIVIPSLATFLIYKFFTFKDSEYGQQ